MSVKESIVAFGKQLEGTPCKLIAVSKTKPVSMIREAYDVGQRDFGENKVQELREKPDQLPKDIRWHMIGHLQTNKVKYIAPFIHLIHAVDSLRLLQEINKQAKKNNRIINCLLQIHIAREEHKFGFDVEGVKSLLSDHGFETYSNIKIIGLMGMASNTEDQHQVRMEFRGLKNIFDEIKLKYQSPNIDMCEISMGMSNDYPIAMDEGSTMIRVGSKIFGARNYTTR